MTKTKATKPTKAAAKSAEPTTQLINIADIVPTYTRESNPNRMSEAEFSALCALIAEEGFLQTVLVSPLPGKSGKYKLLDGHHRYWACQKAGISVLGAHVKVASDAKGLALGIGMNKNRGELDYSLSGLVVQQVMEDTQWSVDQLALLTGFTQSEIEAITSSIQDGSDDILEELASAPPEQDEELEGSAKPYVLEIRFSDRAAYQLARRKLRKAGGVSKDLAAGLLAVLGEESVDA